MVQNFVINKDIDGAYQAVFGFLVNRSWDNCLFIINLSEDNTYILDTEQVFVDQFYYQQITVNSLYYKKKDLSTEDLLIKKAKKGGNLHLMPLSVNLLSSSEISPCQTLENSTEDDINEIHFLCEQQGACLIFSYQLLRNLFFTFGIFDLNGEKKFEFRGKRQKKGFYEVQLDISGLNEGIYQVWIKVDNKELIRYFSKT